MKTPPLALAMFLVVGSSCQDRDTVCAAIGQTRESALQPRDRIYLSEQCFCTVRHGCLSNETGHKRFAEEQAQEQQARERQRRQDEEEHAKLRAIRERLLQETRAETAPRRAAFAAKLSATEIHACEKFLSCDFCEGWRSQFMSTCKKRLKSAECEAGLESFTSARQCN